MYSEKKIIYVNRTSIKLWNFNEDNIVDYFKKRFSSYLSEMGLSWCPFLHPKNHITVRNSQTKKIDFSILINHRCCSGEEFSFLNFDFNHLIFIDITDKEKELRVLNQFNEILKPKNKSNEILKIDESNTEFFLNPSFFLILYDSTNESGNFKSPESFSISIPSYSDLNIIGQKHFDIQGFYEWLYKSTYRKTRNVRADRNPEFTKSLKKLMEESPAYELSITQAKIVRYEYDCSLNKINSSLLSEILQYFSQGDLKEFMKKLSLTKIPDRKDELINHLIKLSDQTIIRDSIIRMCKENIKIEALTMRSSKEAKDFVSQLNNKLNFNSKNMIRKSK